MLTDNPVAPLILIVEDDNNHAELIQRSFEESPEKYRLEIVSSLCHARTAIQLSSPSLILTDYRLPDGDGSELVVLAGDAWPVIIMTSQGSERVAVETMKIGAQDYIVKSPETFENLPQTVKYALISWSLIVARRQVDVAILRAKKDWERTFDAVPDLISIIDINHTILRVNKSMADRCGVTPENLVGRKCYEAVHGLHDPPCCCPSVSMLQDGLVDAKELEEKRLNGIFDVTVSPIMDEEGAVVSYIHVMRDITFHKQIEVALRESDEKHRKLANEQRIILNTSSVGICFVKDRKLCWANPAFELIFGYEAGSTMNMETAQFYYDDESYASVGEVGYSTIEAGVIYSQDMTMKKKDGSLIWINLVGQAVNPARLDEGSIWTFMDISGRKRAEEERKKLEAQFQQTQKLESLGVLAGGIAHDFNNILTIIMGHCYMVKEGFDSGLSDKDHVEKIEIAANRAADLCRQMLAYAGNSPLLNVQINLWLLVDEIVKMLQSAIKKNITIHLDLARDVPEISGDNAHIQQIIMNLIINAAEAIGDKNGTITVALGKTDILAEQSKVDFMGNAVLPGGYACLEVSDDGCGMDEDVQKRIFEPFYTTKFTGRGLGMSAILGILKSHNGALELKSTPEIGTSFKVYFPLAEKVSVVEPGPLPGLFPAVPENGTVLLVDDEEALRTIGSALLEAMGFSVITAADGREALELYKARGSEINLVMLDLIMPEMGGVEAYQELRQIDRAVPIIICSGYGAESVSDVTSTDEKAGFLNKPYSLSELRKMLLERIGG